ncbi:MAG: hypothetical protein JWO82_1140 [Akkermansiaceae bacterium]|nr:hypothetical protein [Akkermansiaceae bacterium]
MNDEWTKKDKAAARAIFERAHEAAEKTYLEKLKAFPVKSLDDLWALESEIRGWRKEVHGEFQFDKLMIEFFFAIFLRRGWLVPDDLKDLSAERQESILSLYRK